MKSITSHGFVSPCASHFRVCGISRSTALDITVCHTMYHSMKINVKVLKKKKKIDRPTQNFNFSTGGQTNIFFFGLIGRTLPKFTQLKRNKRFDNFIMLVWVQSSPFILLPDHILYRKPGGHNIVCTRVKFKSFFSVVKIHTNRFLLL